MTKKSNSDALQKLDLIDKEWVWPHYDNYQWGYVSETNTSKLEDKQRLFLIPHKNAEWIETRQLKDNERPSKKTPVLFRYFADLSGTPESYISFVNKYGSPIVLSDNKISNGLEVINTIDQTTFTQEQWFFKITVKLWDVIQSGKVNYNEFPIIKVWEKQEGIRLQITLCEDKEYCFKCLENGFRKPERLNKNIQGINVYKDKEHKPFAISIEGYILEEAAKKSPEFFLNAALKLIINAQIDNYPLKTLLKQNPDTGILKQTFQPSSLLSLMWYQFYQSVTGERKFKQCKICHQYSDVTDIKRNWDHHKECAVKLRVDRTRRRQRGEDIPLGSPGRPKKN